MNSRKESSFSIKKRLNSFVHAISGIRLLVQTEHNARIHLFAAILAISLGFYFGISTTEWMAIIFSIGSVFACEAFNSALEYLADFTTTEIHPQIKHAKDLAAGAVLISAICALVVGLLVFLPKLIA